MSDDLPTYTAIEHTADLAVLIRAETRESLFQTAGDALSALQAGRDDDPAPDEPDEAEEWIEIELDASSVDLLLVNWLRELLYLSSAGDRLFCEARFHRLSEESCAAEAGFRRPRASEVERELKGITYHDLYVQRKDDIWQARIVVDV